jgi:hypothetical protein
MGNAPVHSRLPPRYRELERRVVWNDGSARCREAEKDFSSAIVRQGLPGSPYETGDNSV